MHRETAPRVCRRPELHAVLSNIAMAFTSIAPSRAAGVSIMVPTTRCLEKSMDKNRIEGTKHEIKGGVKEAAGKVTGNHARELSGNLEKNAGKIQKEVGKANDQARKQEDR
jgi:uncharacterized protein YjbJ (UPF0337 family)